MLTFAQNVQICDSNMKSIQKYYVMVILQHVGESNPMFSSISIAISDLYPVDIINHCSPVYMKNLIEKFKRDSIQSPDDTEWVAMEQDETLKI